MTPPNVAAGGLLIIFAIALIIFAIRVWRKHVKAKDTWVQRSFAEFMREEKARRTDRG